MGAAGICVQRGQHVIPREKPGWALTRPWGATEDNVVGEEKAITGSVAPFEPTTCAPRLESAVIDKTGTVPAQHPVRYEYAAGLMGQERTPRGPVLDLGVIGLP